MPSSRWARELFGIRRRRRRRDLRAAATPSPLAFGLSRWQLGVAVAATTVSVPFHPSPFFSRGGCKTGERGGGKAGGGPPFHGIGGQTAFNNSSPPRSISAPLFVRLVIR